MTKEKILGLKEAISFLDSMAKELNSWAEESLSGGWSTHQVYQNREQSKKCKELSSRLKYLVKNSGE